MSDTQHVMQYIFALFKAGKKERDEMYLDSNLFEYEYLLISFFQKIYVFYQEYKLCLFYLFTFILPLGTSIVTSIFSLILTFEKHILSCLYVTNKDLILLHDNFFCKVNRISVQLSDTNNVTFNVVPCVQNVLSKCLLNEGFVCMVKTILPDN